VGIAFATLYVGVGKLVNVFLSWLNQWLETNIDSLPMLVVIFMVRSY
jgi:hypothetical protein